MIFCNNLNMYKDLTLNPAAATSGVQVDRMQIVSRCERTASLN